MRSRNAPPKALLADELQEAITNKATPFELNRIHTEGQTLLPKATVTIVSNELQGEGVEDGGGSDSRALGTALASAGHRVTLLVIGGPTPVEAPRRRRTHASGP